MLHPWIGYGAMLALLILQFAVRVPFAAKAERNKVKASRRGPLEVALLGLVTLGYLVLPLAAVFTPLLSFADYPLHAAALAAGIVAGLAGLWLVWRSHADLGDNWSVTLEVKEQHRLVTSGVYRRIRHPMYSALFLVAIAQALVLPNWIAGPAFLVAFTILFALRVTAEERMMRDTFGAQYDEYTARTKRLVPGVF